jgi:hypothetical protein
MLTNADKDLKVTPEKRAAGEKADQELYVGQQVEKKIADTPTEGVGLQAVDMSEPGEVAVTKDQISDKYREYGAPVIPIGYDYDEDNRLVWVLSPYHYEMALQGKICFACLEWQTEFPTLKCHWNGKDEGCGADRHSSIGSVSEHDMLGRK